MRTDFHRLPLDNLIDAIETCFATNEENFGVFSATFDRKKAKDLIQDYLDGRIIGRAS